MSYVQHHLRLKSANQYGEQVPPEALGAVLNAVPRVVRNAVAMRFASISRPAGRRPAWLSAASDVRFVEHYGDRAGDTILIFDAPPLGESAEVIYRQPDLFRPLPRQEDTGFDLLGDVVEDIRGHNAESDLFDTRLLESIARFKMGISGPFQEADFWGSRFSIDSPAVIDERVIASAEDLKCKTPTPQTVRLAGNLDQIRASTLGFALVLKSGEEVRGVLREGDAATLQRYFHKDVILSGQAVFRSTGTILRIEGKILGEATQADDFFSVLPKPNRSASGLKELIREQQHKRGLVSIIGQWPGEESDEEIEAILREVS